MRTEQHIDSIESRLVRIRGIVQGVGFREACVRQACAVGVTGWVRNRTDGSVGDPVLSRVDESDFDELWLLAVDGGDGLTSVEAAAIRFGTDRQEWLGTVDVARLRELHAAGEFGGGSMEPKVRAALAFAEAGGRAVITSLERLREGVEGSVGTRVAA